MLRMHFSPKARKDRYRPMSDVQRSPDKFATKKPVPKSIAIPAIAQASLIILKSEHTFEILIHDWLMRNARLLQYEGFEGQELKTAVNGIMQDVLTFFDPKERARFDAKITYVSAWTEFVSGPAFPRFYWHAPHERCV